MTANIKDLNEKSRKLTKSAELSQSMGAAFHQHVKENFYSTTMYKQYLEVYLGKKC